MRASKLLLTCCLFGCVASFGSVWAQAPGARSGDFRVNLPANGPVSLVSADWGRSTAAARGGAMQVDLHSTLQLKNTGSRHIRGVSLLVLAQEVTPGGKASVTVPSLDVAPGESFPVRIDLRLMRPLGGSDAVAEVDLDGVLFDDLSFFGPDRLSARRTLLTWEMEARRDRKAFLASLEKGGVDALRQELIQASARLAEQPRLDLQVARAGRATAADAAKPVAFAFVDMPDSPLALMSGSAEVLGNEARRPRIEVLNRSKRGIRYLEIGWLVEDGQGTQFAAGSSPAEMAIGPGARATVSQDQSLRFYRQGSSGMSINSLRAYLSAVEFSDGTLWVPSRDPSGVSGEQQRLAELYRRRGVQAVVEQLRRLR